MEEKREERGEMDEKVIAELRPHLLNYPGHLACLVLIIVVGLFAVVKWEGNRGIVFLLVLLLLAVGLAALWFRRYVTRYSVTTRRVAERHGMIARREIEIEIRDIRMLSVEQSVLQRILGLGTLKIGTAAEAGIEIAFRGVGDPAGLKEKIAIQRQGLDRR